MNNELVKVSENDNKISKAVLGFSPEEVAIVKNTVAKGVTDVELAFFLMNASQAELNPLNKEIWCYKNSQGSLVIFASRDGFIKKAQRTPYWNGFTSAVVHENDFFEMGIVNNIVTIAHKFDIKQERGEVVGAYCIAKPKGAEYPIIEWADIKTYDKKQAVWKSHQKAMIQKVAEVHCLKKAYGISGLQCEDDFIVTNNIVSPLPNEPELTVDQLQELFDKTKGFLTELEQKQVKDVIDTQEKASYKMALNLLNKKLQEQQ